MSASGPAPPGLGDEIVVAGAGTGKTRALVERVLQALRQAWNDGASGREAVGALLVITFTRAAANELQARIEREVSAERQRAPDARAGVFWKEVLDALPAARIGTIHGACARLLREHPHRALRHGVPLGFEILEEADAATLREESWEATRRRLSLSRGPVWEAYLELASLYGPDQVRDLVLSRMVREFELRPEDLLRQAEQELATGVAPDPGHPERLRALGLLLKEVQELFRQEKRVRSVLTFDDLESQALALLRDEEAGPGIRRTVRHLMVDEFQDTSLRQLELVLALRGTDPPGPRSLFVVGDPHQSIYGFRGAVGTLRQVGARLPRVAQVTLRETHRFADPLLQQVNAMFVELFRGAEFPYVPVEAPGLERSTEVDFVFLPPKARGRSGPSAEGSAPTAEGATSADPTGPGVLLLPSLDEDEEARFVANWIGERLQRGGEVPPWRADDGPGPHPMGPGDVAVLLSARTHQGVFLRELRRRGIPAVPGQSRGFLRRQEVLDVLNLLSALVAPEDAPSLYALLRSPYFAFSDPEIAGWFTALPAGTSLQQAFETAARTDPKGDPARAWRLLNELRARSRDRPPAALIRDALDQVGAWASLADDDRGGLALANVEKLLDRVREFTREGVATLEGVRDKLRLWMGSGEDEGEAEVELARDAVNVLSVHGAKGLQFPVVVLPQTHRQWKALSTRLLVSPRGQGVEFRLPSHHPQAPPAARRGRTPLEEEVHAAEQAEAERLLYVGMTRAMTHLLVTGVGDPGEGSRPHRLRRWHQALSRMLPALGAAASAPRGLREGAVGGPVGAIAARPPQPDRSPPGNEVPVRWVGPTSWIPPHVSWTVSEVELFRRCPRAFRLSQERYSREGAPEGSTYREGAGGTDGTGRELGIRFHERIRRADVLSDSGAGSDGPVDRWVRNTREAEAGLPGPVLREEEVTVVTGQGSVHGRWDAYFPSAHPPRLVDYKTGEVPAEAEEVRRRFGFQLSCYALALPAPIEVGVFHPSDSRGCFWTLGREDLERFRQELADTLDRMRVTMSGGDLPPECADPACDCRTR